MKEMIHVGKTVLFVSLLLPLLTECLRRNESKEKIDIINTNGGKQNRKAFWNL